MFSQALLGFVNFRSDNCTLSLSLKGFDVVGDRNPALRTLHPDEVAWSEPTCVIKSAGFEGKHVLYGDMPFRRAYVRCVIDHVEVDDAEIRIIGRRATPSNGRDQRVSESVAVDWSLRRTR
jgi:hypothetical protein